MASKNNDPLLITSLQQADDHVKLLITRRDALWKEVAQINTRLGELADIRKQIKAMQKVNPK